MKTLEDIQQLIGSDAETVLEDAYNTIIQQKQQIEHLQPFKDREAEANSAIAERQTHLDLITELESTVGQLTALRDTMDAKVRAAIASGDPAQFLAVGQEFLLDENGRKQLEIDAQIAALEAQKQALSL